jgi:hypothetical protein
MKADKTINNKNVFGPSKKCPECYEYMPLHAKICPDCKTRVGDMDNTGMARRATDWKAYGSAAVAIMLFVTYIWWAFFKDMD